MSNITQKSPIIDKQVIVDVVVEKKQNDVKDIVDTINGMVEIGASVHEWYKEFTGWVDKFKDQRNKEKSYAFYKDALTLYDKKHYGDSVRALYQAIKYDFHNAAAHNLIAWICVITRVVNERAIAHSKKAIELSPNEITYLDTLAELYYIQENYDASNDINKKALQLLDPSDMQNKYILYHRQGRLDMMNGQYEEALRKFSIAVNTKYKHRVFDLANLYYHISICFKNLNNKQKALEFVDAAIATRKHKCFDELRNAIINGN